MIKTGSALYKLYVISLPVLAFLFLLLYFILSFHSRISGDDFFYLWLKNNFGAWDGMLYQYKAWSGRWTAHSIGCELVSHWRNPFFLPVINLVTISMLYFTLKFFLTRMTVFLKIQCEKKIIPALVILLITTFFFTSYSIGETWFWYIIVLTYLWSIIAFIALLDCIISEKKTPFVGLLIIIFSTYIGGASESFALIFLGIISFLILYRRIKLKYQLNSTINLKLILALIVLTISFSFNAFAPGTEIRHSLLPVTPFTDKIWIVLKAFIKFLIRFIPDKSIYIILFSAPWLMFGSIYLKNKYTEKHVIKLIKRISIIYLVAIMFMFIPTAFVMSETGPGRALSIISLSTTAYFALLFSLLGIFIDFKKPASKSIYFILTGLSICVLIFTIYTQFIITNKFSEASDERIRIIEKAKADNFKGILELKKLPPEGMLYTDEISEDTSYYSNKHLREGLELPFAVKLTH
jgi:hypothetical protein